MRHRYLLSLATLSVVAGCPMPPAPPPGDGAPALTRPAPVRTSGVPFLGGSGIVGNNGGNIISNNGANLTGRVLSPSQLILKTKLQTDEAAQIVGNNGGNLIIKTKLIFKTKYRLAAAGEAVPVEGATVHLLDAAGEPVVTPDGEPITATTDAEGRYRMPAPASGDNLLVAVELPYGRGHLLAIAPQGEQREKAADIDLVSSLTTGYILDRYVASQAAKQATLNKLPQAVEAETRRKAAAALAGTEPPPRLGTGEVVAVVEAARQTDTGFDAQMETVKKLLIAAGQSNQGEGRPGTEVTLWRVPSLVAAPDGGLYIDSLGLGDDAGRIWKLGTDGKLAIAAGTGVPLQASNDKKSAREAGLGPRRALTLDGQGRLLIVEQTLHEERDYFARLYRLGQDGTLSELWPEGGALLAAYGGAGDEVYVLTGVPTGEPGDPPSETPVELWKLVPGAAQVREHTFDASDSARLSSVEATGRDAAGRLYFQVFDRPREEGPMAEVWRFDPAAKTSTRLASQREEGLKGLTVDATGHLFTLEASGALGMRKPDGGRQTLAERLPTGADPSDLRAASPAADGSAYVVRNAVVYRIAGGLATAVAGTLPVQQAEANAITIAAAGVAVGPTGDLFITDPDLGRILRIGADRQARVFAEGFLGERESNLWQNAIIRADAAGNLYVFETPKTAEGVLPASRVLKLDATGKASVVFTSPVGHLFQDLQVTPSGELLIAADRVEGRDQFLEPVGHVLWRVDGGGQATELATRDTQQNLPFGLFPLAIGASGALYFLEGQASTSATPVSGKLMRWSAAAGLETLGEDPRLHPFEVLPGGLAVDGQGRVYMGYYADPGSSARAGWENRIVRYDPATKKFEILAGRGGRVFSGTTADESLKEPAYLTFDRSGNLVFADTKHQQVKRIPASAL